MVVPVTCLLPLASAIEPQTERYACMKNLWIVQSKRQSRLPTSSRSQLLAAWTVSQITSLDRLGTRNDHRRSSRHSGWMVPRDKRRLANRRGSERGVQ